MYLNGYLFSYFAVSCFFIASTEGLSIVKISPDPTYIYKGETLHLNVSFAGAGDVKVKWTNNNGLLIEISYKDGNANTTLVDDSRASILGQASLSLKEIKDEDNGTYTVSLITRDTVDQSSFSVIIPEQPSATITGCSSEVSITEGNDISCLCKSTGGNPPPYASWYKNSQRIGSAEYLEKRLLLKSASNADSGIYTCKVETYIYIAEKTITIGYKPKILQFQSNATEKINVYHFVATGSTVQLICEADAYPIPSIKIEDTTVTATRLLYTVNSVNTNKAYRCTASNSITSTKSNYIYLRVKEKPQATVDHCSTGFYSEGHYLRCRCRATGNNPYTNTSWIKVGNSSLINGKTTQNNYLTFEKINRTNNGTYLCRAENFEFLDETEIHIFVIYKPEIALFETDKAKLIKGSSVDVICMAYGYPEPILTLVDGCSTLYTANVSSSTYETDVAKVVHTISSVDYTSTSAVYECHAENILGSTKEKFCKQIEEKVCSSGIKSYMIPVSIVAGILVGIVISYVAVKVRQRCGKKKGNKAPNAQRKAELSGEYDVPSPDLNSRSEDYQELGLRRTDREPSTIYEGLQHVGVNNEGSDARSHASGGVERPPAVYQTPQINNRGKIKMPPRSR